MCPPQKYGCGKAYHCPGIGRNGDD